MQNRALIGGVLNLLFVCLLSVGAAYGQTRQGIVEGTVLDTAGIPLQGVTVRLSSVVDTMVTATNARGHFFFRDVSPVDFRLSFSMFGFQIQEKTYRILSDFDVLEMLPILMYPQATLLKEVNINRIVPMVMRGDTIQYNFGAYNFGKNTLLESALKQLGNIQVLRDGTVIAYGKKVSRVQVDGKNFFGGNVLTATKNLHAEIIKHVQVIDSYGDVVDATGIQSNTEPEKILNIVLHEDKKRILFGQATGGAGSKERYIGSFGINNFNDGQELSVLGSSNNTNTSLFSYGTPSGAGQERDAIDLSGMTDPVDGVNRINSFGLSFSDPLSKNVDLYGRYSYTHKRNATNSDLHLRNAFDHYFIENLETRKTISNQHQHVMSWDVDARIDEKQSIKLKPNLSYTNNHTHSNSVKNIYNRRISSEGEYEIDGKTRTPNFGLDVIYDFQFNKPRRKLVINGQIEYFRQDKTERIGDYLVSIDSSFAQPRIDIYSFLQESENINFNRIGEVRAALVEPIGDKALLELSYTYNYTSINSSREVWDVENAMMIDTLGLDFDYFFRSNRLGLTYQVEQNPKLRFALGVAFHPLLMDGNTLDRSVRIQQRYDNWVPHAHIRYKSNAENEWFMEYSGHHRQPSFYQIQPVRDLSNSQNILVGNADLRAEFVNKLSTRFRNTKFTRSQFFETQIAFSNVQNKIVPHRKAIPGSTAIETTYLNTDGYYDFKGYYMFTSALGDGALQMNLNGTADYIHHVSFTNDQKNHGNHMALSQALQLRYSLENRLDVELNSSFMHHRSQPSMRSYGQLVANSYLAGVAGRGYLSDFWAFGFDVSHRANTGYSSYVNSNPTLFNAYLEVTFLTNKMALLRFQGFDIFNQNTGVSKEIYDTIDLSMRNNRLGRYFLVSLNLRLQKLPD